jgi:tetratricopeptide (TPR) repeat protein
MPRLKRPSSGAIARRKTGVFDALSRHLLLDDRHSAPPDCEFPGVFLPHLATSLNNISAYLHELGYRKEALEATREAVDIRRRLAADRPVTFSADLAASLNNFANSLDGLARTEDALEATREAVQIRRRLAADRPDAFLPVLASSLGNLGYFSGKVGLREGALAAVREAVTVFAPVFLRHPEAHARTMMTICQQLIEVSQRFGTEPDAALLGPIFEALRKIQGH